MMLWAMMFVGILLGWGPLAQAQAASITLQWAYTQGASQATFFVVQRCQQNATCPMADLAGATNIPVTQLTYVDSTIVQGTTYCYQIFAGNTGGRTGPSNMACGVSVAAPTNSPSSLTLTIQ